MNMNKTRGIFKFGVVKKTIFGFALISALIVVVTGVAWNMGNTLNESFKVLVDREMKNVEAGNYLIESIGALGSTIRSYVATQELSDLAQKHHDYDDALSAFHEDLERSKSLDLKDKDNQIFRLEIIERQSEHVLEHANILLNSHRRFIESRDRTIALLIQINTNFTRLKEADFASQSPKLLEKMYALYTMAIASMTENNLDELKQQHKKALILAKEILTNSAGLDSKTKKLVFITVNLFTSQGNFYDGTLIKLQAQSKTENSLNLINHEMEIAVVTVKLLLSQAYKAVLDATREAKKEFKSGITNLIIFFTLSVLVALMLTLTIPNTIRRPLKLMSNLLDGLSQGNLSQKANYKKRDEFGELAEHYDHTVNQLRQIIEEISDSANDINSAADSNSQSSESLACEISIQSNEATNVATAMTEMELSFTEVARSATITNEKVIEAQDIANRGRVVVDENTAINQSLNDKLVESSRLTTKVEDFSQSIGGVVDVIRSISEQTNLLALNAAIEAARAGEQGRGFAVVADEVRSLAQKTNESTTEIGEMIGKLQDAVHQAVNNMTECVDAMTISSEKNHDMSHTISEFSEIIQEIVNMATHIATAAEEQQLTATEISRNINGISESTNQTRDAVHQLNTNGKTLTELAEKQANVVQRFIF